MQMQRILGPVVKLLGDNADIKVRYIGEIVDGKISSMHGEKEAIENHRQICIREEQSSKYWDYISCFIKEGNTEECLNSAKIDKTALNACMTDPKKGLEYAKADFALVQQYQVSGSPTLIMNGKRVSEFDFGGRTEEAVKTLLCCGFKEKPQVCSTALSNENAATGFSVTATSSSASAASCGS